MKKEQTDNMGRLMKERLRPIMENLFRRNAGL